MIENVDTGSMEDAFTKAVCSGTHIKRNVIETLPPIIMFNVGDLDYNNCKVQCMNDIEHRLMIQGKYYSLVQVILYGGPSHFRGITRVLHGRYIMYDGICSFDKEKNRVKYLGVKTR